MPAPHGRFGGASALAGLTWESLCCGIFRLRDIRVRPLVRLATAMEQTGTLRPLAGARDLVFSSPVGNLGQTNSVSCTRNRHQLRAKQMLSMCSGVESVTRDYPI